MFSAVLALLPLLGLELQCVSAATKASSGKKKRSHSSNYSLVPPPPPVPVSPAVLAAYGRNMGISTHYLPSKAPRHLAEELKLTAVVDDVAFFKLNAHEESIHLKQGNSFQTVTVAQISPEIVVLEEKGKQYVKRLQ